MNWSSAETLVRYILGPVGWNIHTLVCAVEQAQTLLFVEKRPQEDIRLTRDIYIPVSQLVNCSIPACARRIERLTNLCWEQIVQRGLITELIGTPSIDIHATSDIIFYLAYYVQFGRPYYRLARELLFGQL